MFECEGCYSTNFWVVGWQSEIYGLANLSHSIENIALVEMVFKFILQSQRLLNKDIYDCKNINELIPKDCNALQGHETEC